MKSTLTIVLSIMAFCFGCYICMCESQVGFIAQAIGLIGMLCSIRLIQIGK